MVAEVLIGRIRVLCVGNLLECLVLLQVRCLIELLLHSLLVGVIEAVWKRIAQVGLHIRHLIELVVGIAGIVDDLKLIIVGRIALRVLLVAVA